MRAAPLACCWLIAVAACSASPTLDAGGDGALSDSGSSVDAGPGTDGGSVPCGATSGECSASAAQMCLRCPTGGFLCTTTCTSDTDCANRDLPSCALAPGSVGVCIPARGC